MVLGFYILLRDRHKDERAQAARVAIDSMINIRGTDTGPLHSAAVRITNRSDLPVHIIDVLDPFREKIQLEPVEKKGISGSRLTLIEPSEQRTYVSGYITLEQALDADWTVLFVDAAGVDWMYAVKYRLLTKYRRKFDMMHMAKWTRQNKPQE